jgi:hypothetical protein
MNETTIIALLIGATTVGLLFLVLDDGPPGVRRLWTATFVAATWPLWAIVMIAVAVYDGINALLQRARADA